MKRYLTFAATLLLTAAATFAAEAQTKPAPRKAVQPRPRAAAPKGETMKDGFLMKDGKVMMTRNGQTEVLTADNTLVNGTKVAANGSVMLTDGTSTMLKEGDYVSLTGRMNTMAMKAEQDSLMNLSKNGRKVKVKNKK